MGQPPQPGPVDVGGLQDFSPPRNTGPTGQVNDLFASGNPMAQMQQFQAGLGRRGMMSPHTARDAVQQNVQRYGADTVRQRTQGALQRRPQQSMNVTAMGKQGAVAFGQKVAMNKVGPAAVAVPVKSQRDKDEVQAKLRQTI
jgi:hypothetical protein